MSGTLAPTNEQSSVTFIGIDESTEEKPIKISKGITKNEYVAGGYYGNNTNLILNNDSDALIRKFGDNIVATMLRDPEIKKCDTVLKINVLSDGVTFYPAVNKPTKPKPLPVGQTETAEQKRERLTREKDLNRYILAEKYANFATRAINNLDTPIRSILENMLDALAYGHKVAEQTYVEVKDSDFNTSLLTLSSIRVKPKRSVKFVVNEYSKLVGFSTTIKENGKDKRVILPREKFLVLTFRGKDGDPRGTSILEPVYNAWYLKMQLWPEYLRWLLQSALPSLVGYTSPDSDKKKVLRDATTGDVLLDVDGNPVYEAETESLLNALVQLRNCTAIALPYGAKVEPINNSVSGDPFKGMRDVLNEEIEMGMILQTLATSEGRNMSRAASQTHMSILDVFVFFIKGLVIDMLTNDLLKPLMTINFENFDMSLLPKISMGDSERRDWATDVLAIAAGWKSGFFGESQKVGLDKIIGAPERDSISDAIAAEVAATNLANSKATATPPAPKKVAPKKVVPNKATPLAELSDVQEGLLDLLEDMSEE